MMLKGNVVEKNGADVSKNPHSFHYHELETWVVQSVILINNDSGHFPLLRRDA